MASEVNIIQIVKSRRLIKKALKLLLSEKKYIRLMGGAQYKLIDPEKYETDAISEKPQESQLGSETNSIEVIEQRIDDMPQQRMIGLESR